MLNLPGSPGQHRYQSKTTRFCHAPKDGLYFSQGSEVAVTTWVRIRVLAIEPSVAAASPSFRPGELLVFSGPSGFKRRPLIHVHQHLVAVQHECHQIRGACVATGMAGSYTR